MARTLGAKSAPNVVKLPTRAAKGAASSKPKADAPKLKSGVPSSSRPAPKTEANLREALQLQIVGFTAQHRAVDAELAAFEEEIKAIRQRKKQIRTAIHTAGMPLALFDESYEDAGTSRVDLDRKEKLRAIVREAHGLMVATQGELLNKVAEPAKPEVYWEAQGYQDGIGGKFAEAPKDCPPENVQNYLKGHGNAMKRNAEGITAAKKAMEAQAAGNPNPVGTSGETVGQTTVIPDDDSDRDEDDGAADKTDVEKALEKGAASVDADPDAEPAPGNPALDGAPPTEPHAAPSGEIMH